jgi:hypothetical protein
VNIYIAGKWEARDRLKLERDAIHANTKHKVIGTWLDVEESPEPTIMDKRAYAGRDLAEVKASNLLILDTLDMNERGGREVEYGMALGRGHIWTWIVGPIRNIFHEIASRHFATWDEAHKELAG